MSKLINFILIYFFILFTPSSGFSNPQHMKNKNVQQVDQNQLLSELLHEGDKAPDFTLIDHNNNKFSFKSFIGKPIFLTFVYTSCFDMCPLILHNRKSIEKNLEQIIGLDPITIGITIDPAVDTPTVMKEYLDSTGINKKNLYLLSGHIDNVKKTLKKYKIKVAKIAASGKVVGHYNLGYAIDRKGIIKKVVLFSP